MTSAQLSISSNAGATSPALLVSNNIFWLPSIVFIVHTLEELPSFATWASLHFGPLTAEKFAVSHIPMILLVLFASYKASIVGNHGRWVVLATAFQWQFGVNAIFHLGTFGFFRDYSPGMVTAACVLLPSTGYFMTRVWREKRLTGVELIVAIVVGTVIGIAAVGVLFLH